MKLINKNLRMKHCVHTIQWEEAMVTW